MKPLTLRSQILLAPAAIVFIIMALIGFTLAKLMDIKQKNEAVRDWVRICEVAQGAVTASERMDTLALDMSRAPLNNDDDLHFNYLELSRTLNDFIQSPEIMNRLSPETRTALRQQAAAVLYRDDLDPVAVRAQFRALIPELEKVYRNFRVQKRTAYEDYYNNVNTSTRQLVNSSLWVMALTVLIGIVLSIYTIRYTKGRLRAVAENARAICDGKLTPTPAPTQVRDELDELAVCMSHMTKRLINVVAAEKVLQGAEDERRRIAMDIHDQVLSDLTHVRRRMQQLQPHVQTQGLEQLRHMDRDLEDLSASIRRIIDDLHPQALDMLGLEGAISDYLDKSLSGEGMPEHFVRIEECVDSQLNTYQRLSLYRIIRELVNNIIRHARASRYEVEARCQAQQVRLIVEDNGVGFDYQHARANGGHGLSNIEERAKAIGAQIHWKASRFTSGSRFELDLPLTAPA